MVEPRYMIQTTNDEGVVKYYAIDITSGGYPWMAISATMAESFDSIDKARAVARDAFFNGKPCRMADGSEMPGPTLHSAIGLNNKKTSGSVKVEIIVMKPEVIEEMGVASSRIKEPTAKDRALAKLTAEDRKALGLDG